MFRKLTLVVLGCTVAVAAIASSASAALPNGEVNSFCKTPTVLTKGIYNDARTRGKFDLVPSSTKVNAIVGFTGGANLCGTNPTGTGSGGVFYADSNGAKITYYSGHGRVRCARPSPTSTACGSDGNVANGSYVGNSKSRTYCMGSSTLFCKNAGGMLALTSQTRVRYDTAGPGSDTNRCKSPLSPALLIACESSEVKVGSGSNAIQCSSDIIITKTSSSGKYVMTMYTPTCLQSSLNPMYFLNIDSLMICKGYGTASSTFGASGSCRDSSYATYWLSKNGSTTGTKTYTASATMTGGGGTQTATASVTLTP